MGHSTASLGRGTSYRSDLDCLPGSQTPEEPRTGEQRFMASLRRSKVFICCMSREADLGWRMVVYALPSILFQCPRPIPQRHGHCEQIVFNGEVHKHQSCCYFFTLQAGLLHHAA